MTCDKCSLLSCDARNLLAHGAHNYEIVISPPRIHVQAGCVTVLRCEASEGSAVRNLGFSMYWRGNSHGFSMYWRRNSHGFSMYWCGNSDGFSMYWHGNSPGFSMYWRGNSDRFSMYCRGN